MSLIGNGSRRVVPQVMVLILLGAVVVAGVQGLGILMLPERLVTPATEVSPTEDGELRSLLPGLEELQGTVAVVAVAGSPDTIVLDRLSASHLSDDGRFSLSFRNGALDSLLIIGASSPGTIDGEALDVTGAFSGQSLFGTTGQCTATIDSIEMRETVPFDRDYYSVGPIGAGVVSCVGMRAIGSEQPVSLEAIFKFDQRLCYGGPTVCP